MTKIKVGVVRGGPSPHYDTSLKTGAHILKHMPEPFVPVDVFVNRAGEWHVAGYGVHPRDLSKHIDVAWNALHGEYGEDGSVQHVLDALGIPYTGSHRLPAALSWNKPQMKDVFRRHEIRTPEWVTFNTHTDDERRLLEIFRTFPQPSVVKPVRGAFSRGVSVARSFAELAEAVARAGDITPDVIIEVYVPGKHVVGSVVEGLRGEDRYVASPAESILEGSSDRFEAPARLLPKELDAVIRMTREAHDALGLRHYSQSDFIVSPRGVYIIETDTQPDMDTGSPFSKALAAVGVDATHFIEHVLRQVAKF